MTHAHMQGHEKETAITGSSITGISTLATQRQLPLLLTSWWMTRLPACCTAHSLILLSWEMVIPRFGGLSEGHKWPVTGSHVELMTLQQCRRKVHKRGNHAEQEREEEHIFPAGVYEESSFTRSPTHILPSSRHTSLFPGKTGEETGARSVRLFSRLAVVAREGGKDGSSSHTIRNLKPHFVLIGRQERGMTGANRWLEGGRTGRRRSHSRKIYLLNSPSDA